MSWVIIRKAVLMEDEGREHVEGTAETEQDAKDWIAAQKNEYFKPSDYYYQEAKSIPKVR